METANSARWNRAELCSATRTKASGSTWELFRPLADLRSPVLRRRLLASRFPYPAAGAADLIAASDTFKSTEQFGLRTGVMSNKDYISPEYLVLQRHGWITGAAHACPPNVAPPPCWQVELTPIGVDTFHDLISNGDANGSYFSVPVARRQLIGISGISRSGPSADVEFLWKWVPLNEVGAALYAGGVQYRSTVGFRQYDDGWRVVEATAPKNDQTLDDALKNSEPAP